VQFAERANFAPGDAREDWAILRALSEVVGAKLGFDSLADLRKALYAAYPHFARIDAIEAGAINITGAGALSTGAFTNAVDDFYLTNPIARASAVMAECSALEKGRLQQAAE
jgi:NADH-quinone oxidoreductase subunit G